jgi:hypothetical protein
MNGTGTRNVALRESGQASFAELTLVWTLFAAMPAAFDLSLEASAIGIALIVLGPIAFFWVRARRALVAEPTMVLGLVWLLAVTVPLLLPDLYKDRIWYTLSPSSLELAAVWMYRAWASCCVAYWGTLVLVGRHKGRATTLFDWTLQVTMRRWIGGLGIVGTVSYIVLMAGHTYQILETAAVEDSTVKQIVVLLAELSYAYVYLYFDARNRSEIGRLDTWFLYGVLAVQGVVFIGSGSKYSMLAIAAAWMLAHATAPRRPRLLREFQIAAIGVGLVLAISYVVAAYRGELVSRTLPSAQAPVVEVIGFQLDVMGSAIKKAIQGDEIGEGYYVDYGSAHILDRVAHVSSLALVFETTDRTAPYENALESVFAPLYAVVPRDIIPEKVKFADSGDFAKLYGWTYGGISITTPGSFYWAWGYVGILAGMAALGLYLSFLWSRAQGHDSTSLIVRTVLIMSVIALLDVGVTFQTVVIPATRLFLLLLLLRWGISLWKRHRSQLEWQEPQKARIAT